VTNQATPAPQPAANSRAELRLRPARYVALTPEQEREAITALARLLALVRERDEDQQPPTPAAES
jgi:hypothetical protein